MIDAAKVNTAASIISKLPAVEPVIVYGSTEDSRENNWWRVRVEYPDHTVAIEIAQETIDPRPYASLMASRNLLEYFVQQSVDLEHDYEELLVAFQITFNQLIEENRRLKERIIEYEKE